MLNMSVGQNRKIVSSEIFIWIILENSFSILNEMSTKFVAKGPIEDQSIFFVNR